MGDFICHTKVTQFTSKQASKMNVDLTFGDITRTLRSEQVTASRIAVIFKVF